MKKKIDLSGIDPQKLDPKQEKELFAALSDEELAEVRELGRSAYIAADCQGFARVDMMKDLDSLQESLKQDYDVEEKVEVKDIDLPKAFMEIEGVLNQEIIEKWYPDKDFHTMYICEIKKILVKES